MFCKRGVPMRFLVTKGQKTEEYRERKFRSRSKLLRSFIRSQIGLRVLAQLWMSGN